MSRYQIVVFFKIAELGTCRIFSTHHALRITYCIILFQMYQHFLLHAPALALVLDPGVEEFLLILLPLLRVDNW